LLSGGIDSTLLCWALGKLNAKVRAFTVSTPGDPSDESADAARTAAQLGLVHETVTIPQEHTSILDVLTEAYSEPFGCSSALAMLRVSNAVKPHATVLLTGDGGDDVFLGYPDHRRYWMAQRLARWLPGFMPSLWRATRPIFVGGVALRAAHFMDYAVGGVGAVTRVHDGLPYYEKRGILGQRLAGYVLPQREIPFSQESARSLLPDMLSYELRMQFVGEFLTKVDGGTMHYALEARSPFLDHTLWEFAAALPLSVRLHRGELKAILRRIVRRRVDAHTASRRKQGFTIPVGRWLAQHWRSALLERLADKPLLELDGWVRRGSLDAAIREGLDRQFIPVQLWYLVVLENWLRKRRVS